MKLTSEAGSWAKKGKKDEGEGEQPHSNIQLILAKILRPISRKLGGEETNFAPKITILQPIGGICSGNSLLKPI